MKVTIDCTNKSCMVRVRHEGAELVRYADWWQPVKRSELAKLKREAGRDVPDLKPYEKASVAERLAMARFAATLADLFREFSEAERKRATTLLGSALSILYTTGRANSTVVDGGVPVG